MRRPTPELEGFETGRAADWDNHRDLNQGLGRFLDRQALSLILGVPTGTPADAVLVLDEKLTGLDEGGADAQTC